ncbi:MAG TPA: permease prefix domain 2-containing transporter, partial [Cyclobacteriaceae bacterium]|nr:permease prefix domain 2-containing transporter [Cyclobacteriaceae bacterium]
MIHPPKWADNFLSWYCNPDIIEEVQGDAHELFQKRVRDSGPLQAKALFIWDVIRFFRWSNIKRTKTRYSSNSMTMFKSYLTVGFRNAIRHRLNTSINLLGLSLALGVAITSF